MCTGDAQLHAMLAGYAQDKGPGAYARGFVLNALNYQVDEPLFCHNYSWVLSQGQQKKNVAWTALPANVHGVWAVQLNCQHFVDISGFIKKCMPKWVCSECPSSHPWI